MFRLTWRSLRANRIRFTLTALGVTLAVSFVVSAFVLADGLRSSFGEVSEEIAAGVDLEVQPVAPEFGDPERLGVNDLAAVTSVDGVRSAVLATEAEENTVRPITPDGEEITVNGPPQLAFSWVDDADLAQFSVVDGRGPTGPGEWVVDVDSADRHDFVVGDTYTVISSTGRHELELVGTTSFGSDNETLGAVLMHVAPDQTDAIFGPSATDSISIALADGADATSVATAIEAAVSGTDVVDQQTVEADQNDDFGEGIDIVQNILLAFAGVSLFVSIFIITNTFAIVLGQRTRELALLRAVGADPSQLRRSVMGEALLLGLLSSAAGIAGGVGLAYGLRGAMSAMGLDLPDAPTIVAARTVIAALMVGVGVTLIAAWGPSRRASRVPVIAAMRDVETTGNGVGWRREIAGASWGRIGVGSVLLALGGGLGVAGLTGLGSTSSTLTALAVGAISFFVGVTMVSPLFTRPVTSAMGWPLRRTMGVAGGLARRNAGRHPRRTATTAAALMIGLSLVSMALVVGESVKAEMREAVGTAFVGDYVVSESSFSGLPVSVYDDIEVQSPVASISRFRYTDVKVDGRVEAIVAADRGQLADVIDLEIRDGSVGSGDRSLLVSAEEAESAGLVVGDQVNVEFATGARTDLTVAGIYEDNAIVTEPYLFDNATFEVEGVDARLDWLGLVVDPSVSASELDTAFAQLETAYPMVEVQDSGEFQDRLEGQIDSALAVLNVLVALAVIIALMGIANTLALSVVERTRELGLMRAVGMSRRQLRRMVRLEAGLVAGFGAVLGVLTGVLFGWALVTALPEDLSSIVAIPYERIGILVAIAIGSGLLAAWFPARRAGKLAVLDAIA